MAAKSLEALNKSVRLDIDLAGFVCRLVTSSRPIASHWLTNCRLLKRLIRCSVKVAYADMKSLESDKITQYFVCFGSEGHVALDRNPEPGYDTLLL